MFLVRNIRSLSCLGFLAVVATGSTAFAQSAEPAAEPAASPAAAEPAVPAAAAQPAPAQPVEVVPMPAKQEDKFAMGIFFNPLSIAFGFYGLELDFSPMHLLSINVSGEYYSHELLGVKTSAYGGDIGVQFFLTGQKPMYGLYVYPRIAYAKAKASFMSETAEASLIGIGGTVGYQWNWQPFAFRVGGGVMNYSGGASSTGIDISLRGTGPLLDLTIGFVF